MEAAGEMKRSEKDRSRDAGQAGRDQKPAHGPPTPSRQRLVEAPGEKSGREAHDIGWHQGGKNQRQAQRPRPEHDEEKDRGERWRDQREKERVERHDLARVLPPVHVSPRFFAYGAGTVTPS